MTPFAMRPEQWHTTVHLEQEARHLEITMVVQSTGQWVTLEEQAYFSGLFDSVCHAFRGDQPEEQGALTKRPSTTALERRAYRKNLRTFYGFFSITMGITLLLFAHGIGPMVAFLSAVMTASALVYALISGQRVRAQQRVRTLETRKELDP